MSHEVKRVYLFIGPPGAGKGSLSALCCQKEGWVQLSTGNLCRNHIAQKTPIGKEIDFAIKSGKLISDDLITTMVQEWFSQEIVSAHSVIMDGYPRTVKQAKAFEIFIRDRFPFVDIMIVRFDIEDSVVIDRLINRYICANKECQAVYSLAQGSVLRPQNDDSCDRCSGELVRRSDDSMDSIKERLQIYHKHKDALLSLYEDEEEVPVKKVNVAQPLDKVFDEFVRVIGL